MLKKFFIILIILLSVIFISVGTQNASSPSIDIKLAQTDRINQLEYETSEYEINSNLHEDAHLQITYYKAFDEARVVFSCTYRTFNRESAVEHIKNALQQFCKDHGYLRYDYIRKDSTKMSRDPDTNVVYQEYTSFVKFNK